MLVRRHRCEFRPGSLSQLFAGPAKERARVWPGRGVSLVKSELAEELLNRLMGWDRAAFQEKVHRLEALATYKFDEYDNFRPGVKFFESLAAWLDQFPDVAERSIALNFVLERLIFI